MKDSVIAGNGNSRYLRTSLPDGTTWDDALAMLRAGTFPIDLAGINQAGFTQLGTVLNTQTLLSNETAESLGLTDTAVPSDAFAALLVMVRAKADPSAIPTAYTSNPQMDGEASPGESEQFARGDHRHPSDTSKQDTLTFDETPTEGSTNPVTSGGVWAAESETNTQVAANKSNIETLKSDLLKAFPTDTASGAIASFPDGAELQAKGLTVHIEPVQDLNGYDAPWPAGGGVNKLPNPIAGTTTNNGITLKSNGDGTYLITGSTDASSANPYFDLPSGYTIQDGDYLHIGNDAANANVEFCLDRAGGGNINYPSMAQTNRIVSLNSGVGQTIGRIRVYVAANESNVNITVKPMIVSSSTATAYTPYSNICPISGWDEVNVQRTGKNLLPKMVAGTYEATGLTVLVDANGIATFNVATGDANAQVNIPLESPVTITNEMIGAGLYYHMNNSVANPSIAPTLESAKDLSVINTVIAAPNRIVKLDSNVGGKLINRIRFWVSKNIESSGTYAPAFMYDATATDYEPYTGETYTIDLDGTRYGGTLDVVTGELTVDRAMVDLGTLNWAMYSTTVGNLFRSNGIPNANNVYDSTNYACSMYPSVKSSRRSNATISTAIPTAFDIIDDVYSDADTFKNAMSGVQLCYALAAPITIQLTPQQVTTLLGTNNIWADAGDVSVEYYADPTLYIDERLAAAKGLITDVESAATATKNYAVGDTMIVGNTLYVATAAIAAGSAIAPGTNVQATTVMEQILTRVAVLG